MTEVNPLSAKELTRLRATSKERLTLGSLCKLKEKLLLLTVKVTILNNFALALKYFFCKLSHFALKVQEHFVAVFFFFFLKLNECSSCVEKDSH